jgi:hypothetical protein
MLMLQLTSQVICVFLYLTDNGKVAETYCNRYYVLKRNFSCGFPIIFHLVHVRL